MMTIKIYVIFKQLWDTPFISQENKGRECLGMGNESERGEGYWKIREEAAKY